MTETNHSGTTFWEHSPPKYSEHCPGKTRGIERPGIFQGLVGLDPPRSYTNDPSTINIPRGFLVSNITTFGVAKTWWTYSWSWWWPFLKPFLKITKPKKKGQVFWVQDRCIPEIFPMLKITTVPVYPMIWDTGIFALQFWVPSSAIETPRRVGCNLPGSLCWECNLWSNQVQWKSTRSCACTPQCTKPADFFFGYIPEKRSFASELAFFNPLPPRSNFLIYIHRIHTVDTYTYFYIYIVWAAVRFYCICLALKKYHVIYIYIYVLNL